MNSMNCAYTLSVVCSILISVSGKCGSSSSLLSSSSSILLPMSSSSLSPPPSSLFSSLILFSTFGPSLSSFFSVENN